MKIGILTQWYAPEPGPAQLPTMLAQQLRWLGHDVQVVTGFPNYPTGRIMDGYRVRPFTDEEVDGVRIRRVALYPSHDASAVKRLANYGSFAVSATVFGSPVLRDCDAVWVNYSPITLILPMVANRLRRIPQMCHVLDLWPDTLYASGVAPQGLAGAAADRLLHAWCGAMYAMSARVAYISPGVGPVLASRGVAREKLRYIPMWADEKVFHPSSSDMRAELGIDPQSLVVLYAGALGQAQGLETLVDACREVRDPSYVCVIAGSGTEEEALRAHASDLPHVRFIGRVPQERMTQLCATADINFVGLRGHEASRITMPSKTQAGLAAGKPLLVSAEGDVAEVAEASGACLVADPDVDSVAAQLRTACSLGREGLAAKGVAAERFYREHFSLAAGTEAVAASLRAAAGQGDDVDTTDDEFSYGPLRSSDVPDLARLHRAAFPEFFLSSLGEPFLREFYAAFLQDYTAVTVIARRGDRAVGAVVGSTQPESFFKRLLLKRVVGFGLASARAAIRDPRKVPRLLGAVRYRGQAGGSMPEGALLSSICVDPAERGSGIGADLVERWLDAVRARGGRAAYLTTDRDANEAVNRFYARLGWRLHYQFTTPQGRRMNTYTTTLRSRTRSQADIPDQSWP
ncbi:GNAT family N-acetyltransferase [Mariniluteicoccus flavus]